MFGLAYHCCFGDARVIVLSRARTLKLQDHGHSDRLCGHSIKSPRNS